MIKKSFDFMEISNYINSCSPETKIYIGADSEKYPRNGKLWDDFMTVVVVHRDGCSGAHVFGQIETLEDRDYDCHKPRLRLMHEVESAATAFLELKKYIPNREIIIHLDINKNNKYNSAIVKDYAEGYIYGTCGVKPVLKNNAFAASFAADHLKIILHPNADINTLRRKPFNKKRK